jgi:hypothetical protein
MAEAVEAVGEVGLRWTEGESVNEIFIQAIDSDGRCTHARAPRSYSM